MDINLKYPFEEVLVTVDCGGQRVDMPRVHIAVTNGELDANKSSVQTMGVIHLHPFRSPVTAKGDDGDNMAYGIIAPLLLAAAKVEEAGGREDDATRFREFAADRAWCLKVMAELQKMIDDDAK